MANGSKAGHDRGPKASVVTGEVVCAYCYRARRGLGRGHKACAQDCVDKGGPAGLLTPGGAYFLLVKAAGASGVYARLKEFVAREVRVTGDFVLHMDERALTVEAVDPVEPDARRGV